MVNITESIFMEPTDANEIYKIIMSLRNTPSADGNLRQRRAAGGFRLGRDEEPRPRAPSTPRAPSVSSLSMYKHKIDALFDDSRSSTSLPQCGLHMSETRRESKVSSTRESKATTIYEDEDMYTRKQLNKMNNSVQDRIERMFADISGESRPLAENIGVHVFSVHYLGSTPLQSKVTSLGGLQTPLKDLYFAYRRNLRHKSAVTGRLEISKSGLKVRYKGDKGDLEQLNPFPTIAVWSAVKFIVQTEKENNDTSYAFLPLITDPDNIDRHALFKTLEPPDKKYILSNNENSHSPLFAVVMRKIGVAKQLECHGFVCQTSEDAIVIAATLYKSLMSHMSRQSHTEKKKLKNRNGVSCMSVTSSISPHDTHPVRPPRKKRSTESAAFAATPSIPPAEPKRITVEEVKAKLDSITHNDTSGSDTQKSKKSLSKESISGPSNDLLRIKKLPQSSGESSTRSKVSEKIELFRELERRRSLQRPPNLPPPIPIKPPSEPPPDPPTKDPLRRNHSGRNSINDSGDILTKVAIPRSGSFLNAGGLTRYKSLGHRNNGKKGGGSPLGFNELFNEFKVQENLHSMDDILSAIIDAEGMSFNDLKPIYKEFLLKLAVTLTKDEIFQHSKAIMKKQKKKILRRNSTFQNRRRKIFKGASGLRMVFRMPFGKDIRKGDQKRLGSFDVHTMPNAKTRASESSVSTSSYDLRQFRPKEPPLPPPKRQAMRQRHSKRSDKVVHVSKRNGKVSRPGERTSTSEDSDFLTLSNRLGCQNRNSSSGYVSCSECESDGCVDRCYCSLKGNCKNKCYCSATELKKSSSKTRLLGKSNSCKDCTNREVYDADFSYCSCDSESCADSNKCYCAGPRAVTSRSLEYLRSPTQQVYSERLKKAADQYEKQRTSCADSNKCYCAGPRAVTSLSPEYLRSPTQRVYSERLKKAADQYEKQRTSCADSNKCYCAGPRAVTSRSLEYLRSPTQQVYSERLKKAADQYEKQRTRSSSTGRRGGEERGRRARSSDNLALDYELLLQNRARDTRSRNMKRLTVRSTGAGSHDALSVKKSAEMAALFADVRLSQRTDVRALAGGGGRRPRAPPLPPAPPRAAPPLARMFDHRPLSRNASLEDTLGYLP
ncbi:unnamed protein product [Plutella xylostella]|uniref:(diamondback moth) hypothetical protein n=1 Tax=Plutella xylostella TaxID=51655 RepID=A0A8S4DU14_PLUXY|nr:unnamed protein product [Plutella xylostella]